MGRRPDSGARRWALLMMLPSRWFLGGALSPPRELAARYPVQRGPVARGSEGYSAPGQSLCSSSVIASRLTLKLTCKRAK